MILNGKVLKTEDALISPLNRGQMYGDGCFDTLRVYEGKIFAADRHYDRLKAGLHHIGIEIRFSIDEFRKQITDLVSKNSISEQDSMIRTQCWRQGARGFASESSVHDWMIQCSPTKNKREEIRIDFLDTRCIPDAALSRRFKWANSLNYIIAAREARSKGLDDGIMLNLKGHISETTIANLFWVEGDQIFTPSEECDLYPGITRQITMQIIADSEYELKKGCYGKEESHNAEAFFCTNSLMGIQGISAVGYRKFDAGHPVIRKIQKSYRDKVADESV